MKPGRLKDRIAIITGAARGIGRATALKMAQEGASVAILDVVADHLQRTVGELQAKEAKVLGIKADVSQRKEVEKAVEQILQKWGRVDILVNNAGVVRPALLEDVQDEDWDPVLGVNLKGAFFCTRAVLPTMKKNRYGKIVSIGSRASLGKSERTVYSATKAGLIGLTRTWALELGQHNINITTLAQVPLPPNCSRPATRKTAPRRKPS
jgi:3-oxoacyl-[acyl-carrier protein] reductase